MLGEVAKRGLITPAGARPGNILLLTKGIPIEAASILAREFGRAMKDLPKSVIQKARHYLSDPGISVVQEALIAAEFEGVTAMHDPTEGGLASGLWEMAEAAQLGILVDEARIPLLPEGAQLCQHVNINPLHSIASGALLIAVEPQATEPVVEGIRDADIFVTDIGVLTAERGVRMKHGDLHRPLDRPNRDALAALFEADPHIRDQSDDKRQEEGQHGQGGYGEDVDDEKD
jgi:hydrogenase maturation factor